MSQKAPLPSLTGHRLKTRKRGKLTKLYYLVENWNSVLNLSKISYARFGTCIMFAVPLVFWSYEGYESLLSFKALFLMELFRYDILILVFWSIPFNTISRSLLLVILFKCGNPAFVNYWILSSVPYYYIRKFFESHIFRVKYMMPRLFFPQFLNAGRTVFEYRIFVRWLQCNFF